MAYKIQLENGNVHTPVVLLGDDPSQEGNVLISRLPSAVSVPKNTISDSEGTPEAKTNAEDAGKSNA